MTLDQARAVVSEFAGVAVDDFVSRASTVYLQGTGEVGVYPLQKPHSSEDGLRAYLARRWAKKEQGA